MDSASAVSTEVVKKTGTRGSEASAALAKKHADSRLALKLRKKKAHRRKLNGSHANG